MDRILGLVVARGGSKGVPKKNVRLLGEHPLVAYAVRAAVKAPSISRVVISTDDTEIAEAARRYGCEVPFMRPADLAGDDSPILDAILHAVRTLEAQGDGFDAVCLLQPTTPFRSVEDLENGAAILRAGPQADSVVALTEVVDAHPRRLRRIADGTVRQYLPEGGDKEGQQRQSHGDDRAYRRCGAFYLARTGTLLEKRSLYGQVVLPYVMPSWRSVTIDEEEDLLLAEAMLQSPIFAEKLAHVRAMFE
jgi:CMP-N-acetylneuraminic acid synthetase